MYIHYRKVGKTGGGIAEEREAGREEEYILTRTCFIKCASWNTLKHQEEGQMNQTPPTHPPHNLTLLLQTEQFSFYPFYLFIKEIKGHISELGKLDEKPRTGRRGGGPVSWYSLKPLRTSRGCLQRLSPCGETPSGKRAGGNCYQSPGRWPRKSSSDPNQRRPLNQPL